MRRTPIKTGCLCNTEHRRAMVIVAISATANLYKISS
jgi:hypothetical protein